MKKKKWIIIVLVVVIIPIFLMVYLVGCRQTRLESKLKKVLRDRYDEKFEVVDMYVLYGGLDSWPNKRYIATCRPVDNPDVVFEVDFWDDEIEDGRDNYFAQYVSKQIDYILQEDLEQFFPKCYVLCYAEGIIGIPDDYDFKDASIEEILSVGSFSEDYDGSGEMVYIFIDRDIGTLKKYEDEYEYFTNTIDDYSSEKKMGEVLVSLYYVDSAFLAELEQYFKCHCEPSADMWDEMRSSNNMYASFMKKTQSYIEKKGGINEYIEMREEFEHNNE